MLIELVKGAALMLALCFLYGAIIRSRRLQGVGGRCLTGVLFGSFCILGMANPVVVAPGLFFDVRTLVMGMAALFGGPLVAGIALAMGVVWRVWVGGVGAMACASTDHAQLPAINATRYQGPHEDQRDPRYRH